MKKTGWISGFACVLMIFICITKTQAQEKVALALAVVDAPDHVSGGWSVKLSKPTGVDFRAEQLFICKGVYKTVDGDTATKGTGRVTQSADDHLTGFIKEQDTQAIPEEGDLCYFLIDAQTGRTDVFYKLARFAINFRSVADTILFAANESLAGWNADNTSRLLEKLTGDIQYTGTAMLEQQDGQDQVIKGGDFDGKTLFKAMEQAKAKEVMDFLEYVWARPIKYAGHTWNISEVFATWMTSGTPKITGEINE